ncbi:MAG: DUF6709 family protein [Aggregatilineales bacterium]
MTQELIYSSVRRSNIVRVVAGGIILAIAVVVFVLTSLPYFMAKAGDPVQFSQADVIAMTGDMQPNYNATVFGETTLDTGWEEYTTTNGVRTSTDAYYGALVLYEESSDSFRLLLVKMPNAVNENADTYTGVLVPVPADDRNEVIADLERSEPELKGMFLPVMMSTLDDSTEWLGGLAVLVIAMLGSAWLLITGLMRLSNPEKHPIMKNLSRYGNPKDVAKDIKDDLMMSEQEVEKLRFSRQWVVYKNGGDFEAARFDDLLWIYKHVTQHRTNGIKTGKTFVVKLHDRYGKEITVTGKEPEVDAMLNAIFQRAPWVLAGFNDQLDQAMKKDINSVIQAVEQRKAQVNSR